MKRKIISVMLLSAMLITAAAGCKKTEETVDNKPVLKVYMPNMAGTITDLDEVIAKANELVADKIGAKMEFIYIDVGAYTEKMNMKLASNEEFDICFTSGWLNPYEKAVKNGSYYPMKKLIDENCPELWDTMEDYWWEAATYDDDIYGVPNQQIVSTIPAMTMNKKWAEKYNLDVDSIKTIDDIEPFLQQIHDNEPDVYPVRPAGLGYKTKYESIISCIRLDGSNENEYKAVFEWDDPNYMRSIEKMRDWFKKGYIRQDIASVIDDNNDFKGNKYVITATGWKPGFEASQAAQLGGEHIAILLDDHVTVNKGSCLATMWAISANTKYPAESIKLINEFETNKELYNLLCYGIEGKHYEWIDSEHVRQNKDSGYFMNQAWAFGNQFNAYIREGEDTNVWVETKKINAEAVPARLMEFEFDNSNVQMEISQCETVQSEFKNIFNGSADYTTQFPEYKERMMKAGAQNILNEVQRQLDQFAKTQKK